MALCALPTVEQATSLNLIDLLRGTDLEADVYVKPLDGGEEHMLQFDDFLVSSGAKWTPDGKRLLLLGGYGAPAMSSLNRSTITAR